MTGDEAKQICGVGKGAKCCAYVVMGGSGFECAKYTSLEGTINRRLAQGSMNAVGTGGWEGCWWEENAKDPS